MATVVGLFDNRDSAQMAIEQLRNGGIEPKNIGVAMRSREDTEAVATDTGVTGGAVTGAIGGGVLGGLAGLLVGTGLLAIPGIGPLAAGGWLLTTLTGAGIGAAAGGLVGALVDAGVPEEEARLYQTGIERGGVLVTAQVPTGQETWARDIMNRNGARDVKGDRDNFYTNPDFNYGSTTTTTGKYTGRADDKTNEMLGGAGGAVAGGIIGAAVGGPVGAAVGTGLGAAGGAVAADAAEGDNDKLGAGGGGAAGALGGAAIGGAVAGPPGAVVGGAIGAGAGAAGGEKAEEEVKGETPTYDADYPRTTDTTYNP